MSVKLINDFPFIPYNIPQLESEVMIKRSIDYNLWLNKRRSVRDFSDKPIPKEVVDNIIETASSAPSGAHKQPWTFCIVSDANIKKQIREAAEKEEYESYHSRMSQEWLDDLKALATDWHKPFLETAPYLIIVFKRAYEVREDGTKRNNYYVNESVGIACGFLIAAIHNAGLAALTHTPSPMNFLSKILNRPENERPYLLIPIGHAAANTYVPDLKRKKLDEVICYY